MEPKEAIKKWSDAAKKAQAASDRIMKEAVGEEKKEDFMRFNKFLKKQKESQPKVVKGMRTVENLWHDRRF